MRIIYISWKHWVSFDAFCTSLDFLVVASLIHFIFHCLQFPCIPLLHNSWSIFTVNLYKAVLFYVCYIILWPSFLLCKWQSTFSKNIPVNGFSCSGCEWQLGSSSTTTSQRTIKYDPAKHCTVYIRVQLNGRSRSRFCERTLLSLMGKGGFWTGRNRYDTFSEEC